MLKFNKLLLLLMMVVGLGSAHRANAQTISTTLDGKTGVIAGRWTEFTASATEGTDSGRVVTQRLTLDDAAQADEITLQYKDFNGNWQNLTFVNGVLYFGPTSGFPLQDATTTFRAMFDEADTYGFTLEMLDASTNAQIADSEEEVTVAAYVAPEIASTLNEREDVLVNSWIEYEVTTKAGTDENVMVRGRMVLDDATQATDITAEYKDASNNWQSLTFENGGTIWFGPSTGFPLMDATSQFRVKFAEAAIYRYTLDVVEMTTDSIMASADEFVEVEDSAVTMPVISSTLNNMSNVVATKEVNFSVSTTAGDMANTIVKAFITLDDASQASNISVSYTDGTNWFPLTFNNGIIEFGPSTGFPLMDATTNFRVTFADADTFSYRLDVVEVATGDTLATASEMVLSAPFVAPTIASTLNNRSNVIVGVEQSFDVTTTAGTDVNRLINARLVLENPAQASNISASYFDGTNWQPLTITNGIVEFGPSTGFPLTDATSNFRITFGDTGTYAYSLEILDASTGAFLAFAEEEVVVNPVTVVPPVISSTLNNMSNVIEDREVSFSVSTVANSAVNKIVKGYITLQDTSEASEINVSYTDGINWFPLTFNNDGVIEFGPATGFPLTDATSNFRVTFDSGGSYVYTLDIIEVATGDTLASTRERVIVLDFVAPTISSTLNNRNNVIVNNQITFDVTTTAGTDVNRLVKARLVLEDATQAANITASYFDGANWQPLTFTNGIVEFGPSTGFPLMNATSNFRITFGAEGNYEYTLEILDAATSEVLASKEEQVNVKATVILPTLSSTLNKRTGVIQNKQVTFTVTANPGTEVGRMVRLRWAFDEMTQWNNATAEYMDTAGNWQMLSFINGAATIGDATGFELSNTPMNFRVTFSHDGTYSYIFELRDATNNQLLGEVKESVTVGVNSISESAALANEIKLYPNPAVSYINIELPKTGVSQVVLFTANGQVISQMNNVNGLQTLDISNLAKGVYFVKVINNNQTATKRIEVLK